MHQLYQGDCLEILERFDLKADCVFADPPDNIGLGYASYADNLADYPAWLAACIERFIAAAPIVWLSFNARWTAEAGAIVAELLKRFDWLEFKPCVQVFTFGQHNSRDLANNHRPLWRLMRADARLYPDAIRVESWRQRNGDPRANPAGRVPGDVFDFPRVTGNSKQRRAWHPTQLHEGLVARCVALSTPPGGSVIDPFGGTGTTLRACETLGRRAILIELDPLYCRKIAESHGLTIAA